jgi:hypothetical protein
MQIHYRISQFPNFDFERHKELLLRICPRSNISGQ